ncbi:DUF6000 family protein [Pedobacter caeni]|uniref:Uncharacterized protein n=1 Tax=Pedobacter caeni TaxID=288992 RepID=A0A1M5A5N1_9SPHI|nr:DUF6000 family protein [Pedobacter caeni]SHF25598.1 hypothetical protein SAMN04488522_102599 [Pedobacter caeni]
MGNLYEQLKRHVAGGGFIHKTPFEDLHSYKNEEDLSPEFRDKWCAPFYMNIGGTNQVLVDQLIEVRDQISYEIVLKLLGDFDWRTRQTGAFFAAIKGFKDLTDVIGTHFLKSELTYAGKVYAYTLASFNTPEGIDYLERYLDYYLLKPDLWFDQREAMEALTYLDKINQTDLAAKYHNNWLKFVKKKDNWKKEINLEGIEAQMKLIEKVKNFDPDYVSKSTEYGLTFSYISTPGIIGRRPQCISKQLHQYTCLYFLDWLDTEHVEYLLDELNKAMNGLAYDDYPSSDLYMEEIWLHYPSVTIADHLTIPMEDFKCILEEWGEFIKQG